MTRHRVIQMVHVALGQIRELLNVPEEQADSTGKCDGIHHISSLGKGSPTGSRAGSPVIPTPTPLDIERLRATLASGNCAEDQRS
ncbi:hypothetical protein ACIPD2_39230 [Streptomyces griseofuscus]|uniref:hypothetical protein n=1 Tax=Streptomyces griseofuscus TaxID=146922 RepID=UPI003817F1E6